MKIEAVIFDLDGVICSTDKYHYLAWKSLADRLGIPFAETDNERLRGVGRMECLEIILEKSDKTYSDEEKWQFAEEKNRAYQNLLRGMRPEDVGTEVRETLALLRRKGIKTAIGSSSRNACLILCRTNLTEAFDAVADGTQITHPKPDPEVFLLAASLLGVRPENALVVEDSRAGIVAAKRGGFIAAGLKGAATAPETDIPLSSLQAIETLF